MDYIANNLPLTMYVARANRRAAARAAAVVRAAERARNVTLSAWDLAIISTWGM